MDINEVINVHAPSLMRIAGVAGVAVGEEDGQPCILVLVVHESTIAEGAIPERLEGYPVVTRVTGEFKALDDES